MPFLFSWRRFVADVGARSGSGRRVVERVGLRFMGRRTLHLSTDPHIDRKRNRHHYYNTDSQYEKPPEHPHNAFKDSRWVPAPMCPKSQNDGLRTTELSPSSPAWPALCGAARP